MPTMAKLGGNHPSKNKLYNAGISFREVRSPEAPKIKKTVGEACMGVLELSITVYNLFSKPLGVKYTILSDLLIGMRTEVVALCLNEIRRHAFAAQGVKVADGCC